MAEETKSIVLPTTKTASTRRDPRQLILYSAPKAGKTTLISKLDNCLIIDLEDGSEFVDAMVLKASNLEELRAIGKAVYEGGRPYDFIAIDTISKLEDMVNPRAIEMYKATPMGGAFAGSSILELARGAGYYWLRLAFKEWVQKLGQLTDNLILIGHLKDTFVDKQGKEVSAKELDLTGKIKTITCADADAIAYLHRGPNSELLMNFKSTEQLNCGSRCPHLRGQEIKIADYDEEQNDIIADWSLVYPDIYSKK